MSIQRESFYYHRVSQDIVYDLLFAMEGWIPYIDLVQVFDNELGLYISSDFMVTAVVFRDERAFEKAASEYRAACSRAGRPCDVSPRWDLGSPLGEAFAAAHPRVAERVLDAREHLLARYDECHGADHEAGLVVIGLRGSRVRHAVVIFHTPDNVLELLDRAVSAALKTPFYRELFPADCRVASMDDFRRLPVTPISTYRRQRLGRVVADPSRVQWIVGPHRGRGAATTPVAEGLEETASRYGVFRDALRDALPKADRGPAVVVSEPRRRYFAAEISTILGHHRHPGPRLPVRRGSGRARGQIGKLSPRILVALADRLNEGSLPPSVELCVTFRRSHLLKRAPQLDLYVVDEFGFLAHSADMHDWVVYNDQYLFERARDGGLVVTALRNTTLPLIRLKTMDSVASLDAHRLRFARLDPLG